MDYAASPADIEAPALTQQSPNSTDGSPLIGHTRPERGSGLPRPLTRIVVSMLVLCGGCTAIFCILAPLAWIPFAFIIWAKHNKELCDQPLSAWLQVHLLYTLLLPYCKTGLVKLVCGWAPEADSDPPPGRVKTLRNLLETVPVFWMILGRSLVANSHTCKDTSTALFHFVDMYSLFMVVFLPLRFLAVAIGVVFLQIWHTRSGELPEWMQSILQKANAASPETINKIEAVAYAPSLFADPSDPNDERPPGDCCICLMAYDAELEIKRTQCGHFVHATCLEQWLKRARTCPTCRKDLEEACREDAAPSETELDAV